MSSFVYDVRGDYTLHQSNATVNIHFDQPYRRNEWADSERFTGRATTSGLWSTEFSASLYENNFYLVIKWNTGSVGEYHGRFNHEGRLSGATFDRAHPTSHATWFIDHSFQHMR